MFSTQIVKRETFSYTRHKSVRICGLGCVELAKNSLTMGLLKVNGQLQAPAVCLWEIGPDVIWRRVKLSFGGGLDVWRKENSFFFLESKHDSSVLQLLAYDWAVLVGISFQPDGLYYSLLKLCENSIQTKIHYGIVWRSCFFIIQSNY